MAITFNVFTKAVLAYLKTYEHSTDSVDGYMYDWMYDKCMIGPWAKGTLRARSYQIEHKLLDTFFLAPTPSNQVVKHAPPALGLQHLESMPSSGTAWHYLLTGHPGKNISLTNEEWFYHNL